MTTCALHFLCALAGPSSGETARSRINGLLCEGRLEAGDAERIRRTNV